jgi:hypothetical protein
MFHLRLRPTPLGLVLGVLVIAFWAMLWALFLVQVGRGPTNASRQPGPVPGLARSGLAAGARAA